MEKLKPCPFCGAEAKIQKQIIVKGAVSIVCTNERCGAHIFYYGADFNEKECRRRFNRRANDGEL